jgi:hypothetical protein
MHDKRFPAAVVAILLLHSATALAALPVTGANTPELAAIDSAVQSWAATYGVNAVTVAVVRDKKLVYEKGFGYQDSALTQQIYPDARMRLATNSTLVTRRALRQLVLDHEADPTKGLDPTATVVNVLSPQFSEESFPLFFFFADSRMPTITIQDLLDDTTCLVDHPASAKSIGQTMNLGRNATPGEVIRWTWEQSSTMPSSSCIVGSTQQFSHWSMELAGQIVAQKAFANFGSPYCDPNDITAYTCTALWYGNYVEGLGARIGAAFYQAQNWPNQTWPQEIWYDSAGQTAAAEWNVNWSTTCGGPFGGSCTVPAAYYVDFNERPGSGTIVASARDFARLNSIFYPPTQLPKPTTLPGFGGYSFGWAGGLPGTYTKIVDQIIDNTLGKHNVTVVALANKAVNEGNNPSLDQMLNSVVNNVTSWPTADLYDDVRIQNYWTGTYMQYDGSEVAYAGLDPSSSYQRWRFRVDPQGFTRILNAGSTDGMISNEDNFWYAEYLTPRSWWRSEQWTIQDTGTAGTKWINGRWNAPNRLNVQNQTGLVEQSTVPDYYWSAYWSIQPVPSGATTCSSDPNSPTCLCTSTDGTTPCSCGTAYCPAYWSCNQFWYNAGFADGCDCGCGGWDPDCDLPGTTLYCHGIPSTGTTCNRSTLECQ